MNFINGVIETKEMSKMFNRRYFLYINDEGILVTSDQYTKDWLFQAYPGGRTILSNKGMQLAYEKAGDE